MTIDIKTAIKNLFSQTGFHLEHYQLNKFLKFYDLLDEYNELFDLTRIKSFDDIIIKHFIDSIYITKLIELPSPLIDIGTGAGFPGIPLKILNPELEIILAEPRHKRIEFLEIVIKELNLENITVYPHMVTDKSFFNVNGAITRALETADNTLSRIKHFIPAGGKVILMKGPKADNDIKTLSRESSLNYEISDNIPYSIPGTGHRRKLIVFNKAVSTYKKTYRILKDEDETMGHVISSESNKIYKEFKKLTLVNGIKQYGKAILSGKKIITDFIRDNADLSNLIIFDGYLENDNLFDKLITSHDERNKLYILKKHLFNELDSFNTKKPLLVVKLPEIPDWNTTSIKGCNLLIPFQDPSNVGTVIRTAAGFDIKNIILLKESANPFHPKSVRASAGAVFKANIFKGPSIKDINDIADKMDTSFIMLDKNGADIGSYKFPEDFLLLPGLEGPGLPDFTGSDKISIAQSKNIESFNAAISTSIALYEWKKQVV